jgi:hypothetical protein
MKNQIIESVFRKLLEAPIVDVEDPRMYYSHPFKATRGKEAYGSMKGFNTMPDEQMGNFSSQEYKSQFIDKLKMFNSNIYFVPLVKYEKHPVFLPPNNIKSVPFEKFEAFIRLQNMDEFDKETLLEIFSSYKKKANVKNDGLIISFGVGSIEQIEHDFIGEDTQKSVSGMLGNLMSLLATKESEKMTGTRIDAHMENLFNFVYDDTFNGNLENRYAGLSWWIDEVLRLSREGNLNLDYEYLDSIQDIFEASGKMTDNKREVFNKIKNTEKIIKKKADKDRQRFDTLFRGKVFMYMVWAGESVA